MRSNSVIDAIHQINDNTASKHTDQDTNNAAGHAIIDGTNHNANNEAEYKPVLSLVIARNFLLPVCDGRVSPYHRDIESIAPDCSVIRILR